MKYQAILFDLDGTLLPMDNDFFTKGYFKLLAQYASSFGYQAESLIPAMWKGVGAMVKNDGSRLNYEAFWETFGNLLGPHVKEHILAFDQFYTNEFHHAVQFTSYNPRAKEAVTLARQKAQQVILATNPLFPPAAVATRLSWIGLEPGAFDWITNYQNSTYCKPNPHYYREILKKFDLNANQCLMIGNDAEEDILSASHAGLDTFLVTDCLISRDALPSCPKGTFDEMLSFLNAL